MNIIESVVPGAVFGAIFGLLASLVKDWVQNQPKTVQEYPCCPSRIPSRAKEMRGKIEHSFGSPTSDKKWEWSRDLWKTDKNGNLLSGNHTIYGPFTTDLAEPGVYNIYFKINGAGFKEKLDDLGDDNIIILDVLRHPTSVFTDVGTEIRAIRYVRAEELARPGWHEYKLQVYSDGTGAWEYRALVLDGHVIDEANRVSAEDNVKKYGAQIRILFDTIRIERIKHVHI